MSQSLAAVCFHCSIVSSTSATPFSPAKLIMLNLLHWELNLTEAIPRKVMLSISSTTCSTLARFLSPVSCDFCNHFPFHKLCSSFGPSLHSSNTWVSYTKCKYAHIVKKGWLTSVLSFHCCVGLPLCWKAFSENTTPHQQHWANSIQKSPGNHLYVIGWQPRNADDVKPSSLEIQRDIRAGVNKHTVKWPG